jgi:hypothetical protein
MFFNTVRGTEFALDQTGRFNENVGLLSCHPAALLRGGVAMRLQPTRMSITDGSVADQNGNVRVREHYW